MKKTLYIYFLFILLAHARTDGLVFNIYNPSKAGVGIDTDCRVLGEALEEEGHAVRILDPRIDSNVNDHADINIFIEIAFPEKHPLAKLNWFIPNPEWYLQDIELLNHFDLILCRTHEVERIFKELNKNTFYLGFTSPDRLKKYVHKDYGRCMHFAGKSMQKGTDAVLDVWQQSAKLPHLTIIQFGKHTPFQENIHTIPYRVGEGELLVRLNRCGIHLCLSETEGFGHYLTEALSTAAVVITTDAPPMNEFITDPRCLVPYVSTSKQNLAVNYYVDRKELEKKIKKLSKLSKIELQLMGLKNRTVYLKNKKQFRERLKKLLSEVHF